MRNLNNNFEITNQSNDFGTSANDNGQLIKITENNGKKAVSARDLHIFLKSKQDFSNWIKKRIDKYGFIENQDFEVFNNFIENPTGGRPLTEYALTLDCAKEIAMVEGNAKGKEARQYFIECEKKLKESVKPLSQIELILQSAQILADQQNKLNTIERKVDHITAHISTDLDCFTVAGYAKLKGFPVSMIQASGIGRKASKICKEKGFEVSKIHDVRWGVVNIYPKTILDQLFNA